MRGDAIGHFQKCGEPRQLGLAKFDHFGPVIGPADDGAQGNGQNIEQRMALRARHARVWHLPEMIHQAQARSFGHARLFYGLF